MDESSTTPNQIILENEHGVRIEEGSVEYGHYLASNAICECGLALMVAPMIFHADHKKGDPVMVCQDHGAHAYRFSELVQGQQPKGSGENQYEKLSHF